MRRLPLLVLLTVSLSACAGAPRQKPLPLGDIEKGQGTLTEARKYLEGRWNLESFNVFPPGQEPIQLTGTGTLLYDDFGNLDMEIRADQKSAAVLARAGIQTADGVVSSKGRTVIDLQARTLTYVMEGQPLLVAPTGPLALNLPRHWRVEGNVLTLTTNGADGRPASVGRWVKAP
jgi:hypothetical protein